MRSRLALLSAVIIMTLPACHAPVGSRAEHRDSRTFAAAPGKLVRLDLRSLDAEVDVVTGDSIEVEVELLVHASSTAAARRWLEHATPVMDDSPTRLEISTRKHGQIGMFGFLATDGRVRVKLPVQCALEIHTSSGDVSLRGEGALATPVRIETSSGDVRAEGGARELLVETSSGDVRVGRTAVALLEARTSSGDVRLDAGADRAVIDTSSGEAVLHDLRGNLSVTTSSGNVEARWARLPAGASIMAHTSSGEVSMRIPGGVTLGGGVHTRSGEIKSDFPGREDDHGHSFTLSAPAATEAAPGAAEQNPGAGGAAELSITTASGDVTLTRVNREI